MSGQEFPLLPGDFGRTRPRMECTRNGGSCHDALRARMRMGFWHKLFSFPGYIGAVVLAILGFAPADLVKWLSEKISTEALSWISSDKARWAFVLGAILLFTGTYYRNRRQITSIKPDIRISDAIDYIVNDTSEKVKQPSPPKVAEYGPARGHLMIQRGVEHEDARRLINDQLIAGDLRCWGKRQIVGYLPIQFENAVREIERRDWENIQLSYMACLRCPDTEPQTAIIPGREHTHHWAALMVSRTQIRQTWHRKGVFRRLFDKARRERRVRPWGGN
jgi:hypothetical protein